MEEQKKDIINKIVDYLKSAYDEFNKVTWPSKNQTKNYTLIVIGLSVGLLVFFTFLDYIFELGIVKILK